MTTPAILRGIAWNHTRGFTSIVATAQRFEELHPEISIQWQKRSLQAFADVSIARLATEFDLIIMDHPHTALAATKGLLLPFEDWLPAEFLEEQAANSVGASHASYRFAGKQWTLATDAAAPVATWRPDLIANHKLTLPKTWEDVLELARRGFVAVSAFPIDVLMHSYMFSSAIGHAPFSSDDIAPDDILAQALMEIRRLVALCDPACLGPTRFARTNGCRRLTTPARLTVHSPSATPTTRVRAMPSICSRRAAWSRSTDGACARHSAARALRFRRRAKIGARRWTLRNSPRHPMRKREFISKPAANLAIEPRGWTTL
jgi:hypothetical protein